MHYLVVLVFLSAFASAETCVVLAPAPLPTGIATWSRAGQAQRHAMLYLAGEYPKGMPFRTQIKDKDVEKIRAKGGRVVVLDRNYTREDLEKAKGDCK